jgi:hypothetical protein
MKFFYSVLLLCNAVFTFGQSRVISGTVSNETGETIPFASVFVAGTSRGVSANANGFYQLVVNERSVVLSFSALGYKTLHDTLIINQSITLNKILQPAQYQLKDVVVRVAAEDPAYAIIRQAIQKRKTHLKEIKSYRADVYIKGVQKLLTAPKKIFGKDVSKTFALDSNRSGILYLSESQSKFSWMYPNQIKEEMLSSKVSGRNNAFSFNKASDLRVDFYQNVVFSGNELSSRGFISPVADNALFYYRYKWLGSTEEDGMVVNKIAVYPKRKNDPAFTGFIYITEGTWKISGLNLYLTKESGIQFIDSLNISQHFVQYKQYLLPNNLRFDFSGALLGFKFKGYFLGFFSNYEVNCSFPPNYFTNELLKVNQQANQKDTLFWSQNRPVPLTADEKDDYRKKDSLAILKSSKPYLDSVDRESNKITLGKAFLKGYHYFDRFNQRQYNFDPILTSLYYNTIEGAGLKYGVGFQKKLSDRRSYQARPEIRYGAASKMLTANLSFSYLYNPKLSGIWRIYLGSDIVDLNNNGTVPSLANTLNTLFYERNYPKYYRQDFVKLSTQRELADGLQGTLALDVNQNSALLNHNLFTFRDFSTRQFSSNNPLTPTQDLPLFASYRSTVLKLSLNYKFGQKYISMPNRKYYLDSPYPQLSVNYQKGLRNVFSGKSDFDFIAFEIFQDKFRIGMLGFSSFTFSGGAFLNNRNLLFPEFKHFRGNNTMLFKHDLRNFGFLDFYQFSTSQRYLEAHFEHSFSGFILNKIPLLRSLKLDEFTGINYLSQPNKPQYVEWYFGLRRLMFGISYGYAFENGKLISQGMRYTYSF